MLSKYPLDLKTVRIRAEHFLYQRGPTFYFSFFSPSLTYLYPLKMITQSCNTLQSHTRTLSEGSSPLPRGSGRRDYPHITNEDTQGQRSCDHISSHMQQMCYQLGARSHESASVHFPLDTGPAGLFSAGHEGFYFLS